MTDTLFADISEFQSVVDDRYPYRFISIRSNDGTYTDKHFAANLAWAKAKCDAGQLDGFIVYFVYEPNWKETVATFMRAVGVPHPQMAVMLDVERWGRKEMAGDHSAKINGTREAVIAWLGQHMSAAQRLKRMHRKRVIGYGNAGDLAAMWPRRGNIKLILANYSANPAYPNKIGHQFGDNYYTPPFGNADINSADGLSPKQFAKRLGLVPRKVAVPVVAPLPTPAPRPSPIPKPDMASDLDARFTALRDHILTTYGK